MKSLLVIIALSSILLCACSTRPSADVVMSPAKIGKPPFDSLSASIADEIFTGCTLYEMKFERWPRSSSEIEAGLEEPAKFLSKSYITLSEEAGALTVRYMVPSGAVWDMVFKARKPKEPNKALEPTTMSVTPRAIEGVSK